MKIFVSNSDPEIIVPGYGILRLSQAKRKAKDYVEELLRTLNLNDWSNASYYVTNGVLIALLKAIKIEEEKHTASSDSEKENYVKRFPGHIGPQGILQEWCICNEEDEVLQAYNTEKEALDNLDSLKIHLSTEQAPFVNVEEYGINDERHISQDPYSGGTKKKAIAEDQQTFDIEFVGPTQKNVEKFLEETGVASKEDLEALAKNPVETLLTVNSGEEVDIKVGYELQKDDLLSYGPYECSEYFRKNHKKLKDAS